jgi:hypothetical protein
VPAQNKKITATVDLNKNICLREFCPLNLSKHDAVKKYGAIKVACSPVALDIYWAAAWIPTPSLARLNILPLDIIILENV